MFVSLRFIKIWDTGNPIEKLKWIIVSKVKNNFTEIAGFGLFEDLEVNLQSESLQSAISNKQ